MFTYRETIQKRREKIESLLTKEYSAVAVIMAAANFEWTLRRAILALGKKPTAILRKEIEGTSNLNRYKDLWAEKVIKGVKPLPAIIPKWEEVKKAYTLRNELVHGNKGTTGLGFARKQVVALLDASEALNKYVISTGAAIYGIRIRRIRSRE
jgi:hypothetical protein